MDIQYFKTNYKDKKDHRDLKILDMLNSKWFRISLTCVIIIDVVAVVLNTITNLHDFDPVLYIITFFSALLFTLEYILRLISAPAICESIQKDAETKKHYRLRARIKYLVSFLGLVDLISISPFVAAFFSTDLFTRDIIDLGRVILVFKLLRYSHTYRMIKDVVRSVRYELLIALMLSSIIVSFSGILIYYIERDAQPEKFTNVGEGFWGSIITYTTVGYGDVVPVTPWGKFLSCFIAVIGIVTLMLPTGILSGALMNKLQQENAKKLKEEIDKNQNNQSSDTTCEL